MKKNFMLFAAALVVFAACNKEQDFEQPAAKNFEIYATVEQQTDDNATKSSLSGTTVSWTANDSVKVFDESGYSIQMKAASSGTSVAFTENTSKRDQDFSDEDNHYAIYPYSAGATCTDGTITFSLPATQTYAENSFAQDANVAVASFSGSSAASFKNACGVFKLSLCGNFKVSKIVLKTKGEEKLCGTFKVNAASVGSGATHYLGGVDSLTLNCVTSEYTDGVQLKPTDSTTFYFVVPVGAFASGFVAKVYEKDNTTAYTYTELSTTKANTITRSRVKAMPGSTILPPAYQQVEYLESTGTQFINTAFELGNGDFELDIKFQCTTLNGYYNRLFGVSQPARYVGVRSTNSTGGTIFFENHMAANGGISSDGSMGTNVHTIIFNRNFKYYVDNNLVGTIGSSYKLENYSAPLYLFNYNMHDAVPVPGSYKIYYCQIIKNGTLARDFIPTICKAGGKYKDGNTGVEITEALTSDKPGMYDLVTGKFFVNQGSGDDFTTGSAVTY